MSKSVFLIGQSINIAASNKESRIWTHILRRRRWSSSSSIRVSPLSPHDTALLLANCTSFYCQSFMVTFMPTIGHLMDDASRRRRKRVAGNMCDTAETIEMKHDSEYYDTRQEEQDVFQDDEENSNRNEVEALHSCNCDGCRIEFEIIKHQNSIFIQQNEKLVLQNKKLFEQNGIILKKLNELLELQENRKGPPAKISKVDCSLLPEFPLTTVQDFQVFDTALQANQSMQEQFITKIGLRGGKDGEKALRLVADMIMTNDVCLAFTWTGKSGKTYKMANTKVANLIIGTLIDRYPGSTIDNLESAFANWLRHAGDRIRSAERKMRL